MCAVLLSQLSATHGKACRAFAPSSRVMRCCTPCSVLMPLRSSARSKARSPSPTTAGTVSVARPSPASTPVPKSPGCCSATRRVPTCTARRAPVRKLLNRYRDTSQQARFGAWWLWCPANSVEGCVVTTVLCCARISHKSGIFNSEHNNRLCFIVGESRCVLVQL